MTDWAHVAPVDFIAFGIFTSRACVLVVIVMIRFGISASVVLIFTSFTDELVHGHSLVAVHE